MKGPFSSWLFPLRRHVHTAIKLHLLHLNNRPAHPIHALFTRFSARLLHPSQIKRRRAARRAALREAEGRDRRCDRCVAPPPAAASPPFPSPRSREARCGWRDDEPKLRAMPAAAPPPLHPAAGCCRPYGHCAGECLSRLATAREGRVGRWGSAAAGLQGSAGGLGSRPRGLRVGSEGVEGRGAPHRGAEAWGSRTAPVASPCVAGSVVFVS